MSSNNQLSQFTLEQMKEYITEICPFSWEVDVEKTDTGFNFTHYTGEQIKFFSNQEVAINVVLQIESWLYDYRAELGCF